jgi:hypothetical protein
MSETTIPATTTEPAKRSKAYTPSADISLKDLATTVAANWKLNPLMTLIWTKQSVFEDTVNQFNTSLGQRLSTGGGRSVVTNDLKNTDQKVKDHTEYLKVYLKEKYGKDDFTSYFPQFGIVKQGSNYVFPADRNKRNEALKLTIEAIQAHGFAEKTYGLAFWQEIKDLYEVLLNTAVVTDGNLAGLVNTKNQHRALIVKTLNALIHIIKGNYPDDYAAVLRTWGFQKEKY